MATKKKLFGFAAISAAVAGILSRLRKRRAIETASPEGLEADAAAMQEAAPMAEVGDKS